MIKEAERQAQVAVIVAAKAAKKKIGREAVRIASHSGLTRWQFASDLGIGFSALGKWMRDYSTDPSSSQDAELRRENEILRKENRFCTI